MTKKFKLVIRTEKYQKEYAKNRINHLMVEVTLLSKLNIFFSSPMRFSAWERKKC